MVPPSPMILLREDPIAVIRVLALSPHPQQLISSDLFLKYHGISDLLLNLVYVVFLPESIKLPLFSKIRVFF